jgi:predicted ATP-grasp superfamily ATP-dependent carboligase
MYKVLLVSIASFFDSTGEIPFMFKRAGCKVDVFCDHASWLLSNKYYDEWIKSSDDPETFKNELIALVEKDPDYYDWVVLLEDISIKLFNESVTEEWLFKKLLPLTKIENREVLSSKMGLSTVCEKYGIVTPRFLNYSDEYDLETIQQKLQFPILLKEDFSFSGIGVHYCDEPWQFEWCLDKALNTTNLVLQEFIKGDDVGLEALFKDGELITYNCAEVLSYMYNRFSFTTRRRYYQNEQITELLKTLGKSIGLNGFASIQYIYHPERDIYYLIELDARTNSWMPYSRFTEHDFSAGIKRIIDGSISFMEPKTTSTKKIEVVIFDRDIRRCIKNKDFKGLLKWVFNYKGYWKFIPLYDRRIFKRVTRKIVYDFTAKLRKPKRS